MQCLFPFCSSSSRDIQEHRRPDAVKIFHNFDQIYRLDEQIGKGGFAIVNLAHSLSSNSKVAVKILKKIDDSENIVAFEREYRIIKSMQHPNIILTLGFFRDPDKICIVLEYMEGGELFDRIVERKVYTEDMARKAFKMLLNAVHHLHAHHIIHRDLKPENLLLTSKEDDGVLKVCDFGLARDLSEGGELISRAGTPDYIAPEIVQSRPLGLPVDMWAAGVILFILLGGYSPFHKRDKALMFQRICTAHFSFHPTRWDHISEEAKDLIKKLLQINEEVRLTAQQALDHPWMQSFDRPGLQRDISVNLAQLRQFNAMRKLRGSVRAVIMANRLKRISQGFKGESGSEDVEQELEQEEEQEVGGEEEDDTRI